MFNTVNADVYGEFAKTGIEVKAANFDFDAFVDAAAALNLENIEDVTVFAFICPKDKAKVRKALKDTLQYVEAYARSGYIGTVAGINIYAKADATEGEVIVATKDAVTIFEKVGVEMEQERDANTRVNSAYSRKYYVVALTDESKAVKITLNA
jgi:hydrogenase maturation factor